MKEVYRTIKEFPKYEVSSVGNIRNLRTGKTLKPCIDYLGYGIVNLYNEDLKLHRRKISRLVAKAFIPNPENKRVVNHKDLDKSNDCVDNLEWCTHKENTQHAMRNGIRMGTPKGYKFSREVRRNMSEGQRRLIATGNHPLEKTKKPVLQYKDGELVNRFESMTEAAKSIGVCQTTISKATRKGFRSGGFTWVLEEMKDA